MLRWSSTRRAMRAEKLRHVDPPMTKSTSGAYYSGIHSSSGLV